MRLPQAIALGVALIIVVLLFIAPRTHEKLQDSSIQAGISSDSLLLSLESTLDQSHSGQYAELKRRFNDGDTAAFGDLRKFWIGENAPFGIAVYQRILAERTGLANEWIRAGKDFHRMALFAEQEKKGFAYELAIHAFNKALEIAPGNKEARLKLGVCLVEGSGNPMKGVELLLGLVKEDSTDIDAHLQLGFFSLQSRQFDKAIDRFKRILEIDSLYADSWLYIGQALEMKGELDGAVMNYEKYYVSVQDTLVREQLRSYIDKIKQTKSN